MDHSRLTYARDFMKDSVAVMAASEKDEALLAAMLDIAGAIESSLRAGGKVMFAGNGGSAGDAQHIAGEFVSRLNFDRAPLAGLALTTDTSILTAVGNDYGYDRVFERQVLGLGNAGDVFVGIFHLRPFAQHRAGTGCREKQGAGDGLLRRARSA